MGIYMNEGIRIFYDERKVIISTQIVEKLKYLMKIDMFESNRISLFSNEMCMKEFYEIINTVIHRSTISIQFLPRKDNEINYNTQLIYNLYDRYNKLFPKGERRYDLLNMDVSILGELIDIIYQINLEIKNYYYMRDLIGTKEDCLENMKYFVDTTAISLFNVEYDKAIQTKDIKKMEDMLNHVQQDILKEWERYITDIDAMNDDNFIFIGHSTSSTKFDKEFYSRYISCSLLTSDLTDTYRSGYGFILAPQNIIGANSRDMYANNYVQDEEILLNYSSIKKIVHPQRLIDECLKQKQENKKNGIDDKVYSEVIIDGFKPIGIFCFTDGSKNLNCNYQDAKKLQEYFPNLKIYSFDIMKRKKGVELESIKLFLLNHLQEQFTNHNFQIDKDMLSRYDYFFEEYTKLKQESQYTECDIEKLFKHNDQLLSYFIDPEKLFSGSYSDKDIRYILSKNVRYNIDYILSGRAKSFALNNLKELSPYKDKLNSIYDGLSELVDLVSKYEVTDEMMIDINDNGSINFYTITKVIASKLMELINNQEVQATNNLNSLQVRYNELLKELQERTKLEKQYNYYLPIYNNRFYVDMLKSDYNNIINQMNDNKSKEYKLSNLLNLLIEQLNVINERLKLLEETTYSGDLTHLDTKKQIEEIKSQLAILTKHPLINRKRIEEAKRKLDIIETNDLNQQIDFDTQKAVQIEELYSKRTQLESKIHDIELSLGFIHSDKKHLLEQLDTLKNKMIEYYKCDSIEKVDLAILEAERFNEQYDSMNKYYLSQLEIKIKEIANAVSKQKNRIVIVNREKEQVSKLI